MRENARRYLGLELSGAKNSKTALSILEFYPKEQKTFLLDIHDRVTAHDEQTGDQALLELLDEVGPGPSLLGVNVALTLPPCLECQPRSCKKACSSKSTQWMERFARKKSQPRNPIQFTAYTQRPVELWVRHEVLKQVPKALVFEVDEAMGGSRAPLTARMHYLKRHLAAHRMVEVWPKLSALKLCLELGMDRRLLSRYRKLEEGAHARMGFLEVLSQKHGIFIYDRDLKKLSHSLAAFDSFLCAYTALLSDQGRCEPAPRGFPEASGWVHYPSNPEPR